MILSWPPYTTLCPLYLFQLPTRESSSCPALWTRPFWDTDESNQTNSHWSARGDEGVVVEFPEQSPTRSPGSRRRGRHSLEVSVDAHQALVRVLTLRVPYLLIPRAPPLFQTGAIFRAVSKGQLRCRPEGEGGKKTGSNNSLTEKQAVLWEISTLTAVAVALLRLRTGPPKQCVARMTIVSCV